ncbi:MAG: hypothetical protein HC854_01310 [Flavobacterium sp.]|nr:hypothetical protein [Flavobacterium sp.]
MKENKNIERLFQEKFKDFEATPPEATWNNIASRLQEKKKKRRVIPFWFKASGIAASLIIGMFLYQYFQQDENSKINTNPVVIDENKLNTTKEDSKDNFQNTKSKEVVVETSDVNNEDILTESSNTLNKNIKTDDVVVNASAKGIKSDKSNKKGNIINNDIIKKSNQSEVVVNSNFKNLVSPKQNSIISKKTSKEETSITNNTNNAIVVENNKVQNSNINKGINATNEDTIGKETIVLNTNVTISNNLDVSKVEIANKTTKETVIAENNNINKTTIVENNSITENKINEKVNANSVEKLEIVQNVITKDIKEQNTITETDKYNKPITKDLVKGSIKDSANVITQVEAEVNALEQLLKEKEEGRNADEKEKEKRSKWAVSSNASPVYFNSISQGSPIDEQFAENEKSYATSLSYGLGLEYALTNRISIRSGVNAISINYNTNEVYYANSLARVNATTMNVSRNENAENLVLNNRRSSSVESLSSDVENFAAENVASLNQKMGYVEVPLELSYKILDKKFGINFIGGMSTLFLNNNEIALVSNGSQMVIGEANNLNNIHFSSNVGLGFKYSFWKSFNANFQPMFKYQINTFNEDSGNFKPFIIGLYSGISFNF